MSTALLAGCVGEAETAGLSVAGEHGAAAQSADAGAPNDDGSAPKDAAATDVAPTGPEALFDLVQPGLVASCGNCHGMAALPASYPKWLVGPDRYGAITAYPGIVVPEVQSSKLLTIGVTVTHAGGAGLPPSLVGPVTTWLTAEANALSMVPLATSGAFTLTAGANVVDLSSLVPGASLSFTAEIDVGTITFDNLEIAAPASTGLHVAHPIFQVLMGNQAYPDVSDSFSDTDETVPAGQAAPLGDGIFVLDVEATTSQAWQASDELEVAFTTLEAATAAAPDAGMD